MPDARRYLIRRHLLLPTLSPLMFFAVAFSPVELLGCRNRGLLALAIALPSVLLSLTGAIRGNLLRWRGQPGTGWWLASSLILAVPAVALLYLA